MGHARNNMPLLIGALLACLAGFFFIFSGDLFVAGCCGVVAAVALILAATLE